MARSPRAGTRRPRAPASLPVDPASPDPPTDDAAWSALEPRRRGARRSAVPPGLASGATGGGGGEVVVRESDPYSLSPAEGLDGVQGEEGDHCDPDAERDQGTGFLTFHLDPEVLADHLWRWLRFRGATTFVQRYGIRAIHLAMGEMVSAGDLRSPAGFLRWLVQQKAGGP